MDALKAEARKIEAEIEAFSSRTAKEVADLLTAISNVEDESDRMTKRERYIDAEVETLLKEKTAIKLSLKENEEVLRSLSVKKIEMDKMIDAEMEKFKERDTEVKEILGRVSNPEPPKQTNANVDSQMVDFLKKAIARKEEDLVCPVCLEIAQVPIFTCPDSHIICSACVPKLKVQECPQCRVDLPTPLKRNRFAEKTAVELEELLLVMRKLTDVDPHQDQEPKNSLMETVQDPMQVEEMVKVKEGVSAILDNLSPQTFEISVEKFRALPITKQTHLQECVELIVEKAVNELGSSVACARMCQVLQMKKVLAENSETETVNFRKLLISRCQKEFDRDYMEGLDRDKYLAEMAAAQTDDERKQVEAEFEQMEMQLRKRSLGNIRFLGELFMLQMLTARIMHECVKKLLKTADEESLECLCKLLTIVGQALDTETKSRLSKGPHDGLNDLSFYFAVMKRIIQDKRVCSRVSFLMQDVIELRAADWKTLEQK